MTDLTWVSHHGQCRDINCDAGGYVCNADWCLCIVVDAAERSENSSQFAIDIVSAILTSTSDSKTSPSNDLIINALMDFQYKMRDHHLMEMACYAIAIVDHSSDTLTIIHCGDCLVGIIEGADVKRWLINPHNPSLAISTDIDDPIKHCIDDHHVFKSLKAKRFKFPEITVPELSTKGSSFVLATDGFWRMQCVSGCIGCNLDDASHMTVSFNVHERDSYLKGADDENFLLLSGS